MCKKYWSPPKPRNGRERDSARASERQRDLRQRSTPGSVTLPPRHSQPTQSVHWRRVHSLQRRKNQKKKKTLYTKIHSWSGPLSLVRCREMSTAAAPNNGSDSLEISRILNYILKIVKNTNPSNNTQNSTDYVGDS